VLAVLEYGELPELLRVAETAQAILDAPPVFFFVKQGYRRLAADTAEVIARGFQWMDAQGRLQTTQAVDASPAGEGSRKQTVPGTSVPALPSNACRRSVAGRIFALALLPVAIGTSLLNAWWGSTRIAAREVANFTRDVRRFRRRYSELHTILAKCRPSMLIVGQDGPGGDLSLLLIAAGRQGIPRLITPFAMFSIQETADYAAARSDHQVKSSGLNRVVAKAFPHWVLRYMGRELLRLPGYRALALEMTGLIRGLPWTPLSEPVEAITADSEVAAEALDRLGVERALLHVIGSPVQDRLASHLKAHAVLRERLCREHGLDPTKPLVFCGWPVNMFAWLAGRPIHYPDYEAVAAAWTRVLGEVRDRHQVNVIISIHPKTLPQEYAAAEQAGLPCRRGGADELIAICDLFTTLNGSSITAWAIACGKPVLLFDCFQTKYSDFLDVPGCLIVETEEAFAAELHALCEQTQRREAFASRQNTVASRWGQLDGEAGARLGGVIRQLVAGDVR
jgi:hypothetical protein